MTVDEHRPSQVVALIAAAMPDGLPLLEMDTIALGYTVCGHCLGECICLLFRHCDKRGSEAVHIHMKWATV